MSESTTPPIAATPPDLPDGFLPGGRYQEWSPKPPRFVLSDVDGTLLGVDHDASVVVSTAIAEVVAAGVRLGLATGRTEHACLPLLEQLGAAGPHVLENGAQVRQEGTVLAAWPLDPSSLGAIEQIVSAHDLYVEWYLEDGYWASEDRPAARAHWKVNRRPPHGFGGPAAFPGARVVRATVVAFASDDVAVIVEALRAEGLGAGGSTAPALPGATFINITNPEADKGIGLRAAAAAVGVDPAEVVAIGDGDNDRPMLAVAGTAIAMGQALPETKAEAHLIAPEFHAEGAAHAMRAVAGWVR